MITDSTGRRWVIYEGKCDKDKVAELQLSASRLTLTVSSRGSSSEVCAVVGGDGGSRYYQRWKVLLQRKIFENLNVVVEPMRIP